MRGAQGQSFGKEKKVEERSWSLQISSTKAMLFARAWPDVEEGINGEGANEDGSPSDQVRARASESRAEYEPNRSEERRVGKEWCTPCRSRWSPYH